MAGYMIENILNGQVKNFHWHDVDALPCDGSVTPLDVRTPGEFQTGKISGFTNVPLDELRKRLNEVPKGKPVYLHCHSGLRSYIAARILMQNGYEAYNLSGGYRLYLSVKKEKAE
jgi:rhodanese-related sulfurtransferase